MQSIGGSGGNGGAAYGTSYSAFYGASISVGGASGAGGDGGTVNAERGENNAGSILTSGAESFGIRGQSIGGGGGAGGTATAKSEVQSGGDLPGLSLTLATGGKAGGGAGDTVYLQNSGLIATSGNGAIGIVGQSIGGGTGGDASGASTAATTSRPASPTAARAATAVTAVT